MSYTIAAFTIRDKALFAFRLLSDSGISCRIINTPRAAGLGCGLSVQLNDYDRERVGELLYRNGIRPDSFFEVTLVNNKTIVARL